MPDGNRSRNEGGGRPTDEVTSDGETRRHWIVVLSLVISFLIVPWALIVLPSVGIVSGTIGLPFRDAYLVLPLIPAVGLGLIAVWSVLAARRSG